MVLSDLSRQGAKAALWLCSHSFYVPWHSAPAIWARFLGQGAPLWYSVAVATTHAGKG
jgi:hypothetical protein